MEQTRKEKILDWFKKLGFWGFMFFLAKGIFWILLATILKDCSYR
jgi:hypothetical protein